MYNAHLGQFTSTSLDPNIPIPLSTSIQIINRAESDHLVPSISTHNRCSPLARDLDIFVKEALSYTSVHPVDHSTQGVSTDISGSVQVSNILTNHFLVQSPTSLVKEKRKIEEVDEEGESARTN